MPATELRVVFVVDASVSAGEVGVARALQLVQAVLDELPPDAGWALVTATRRATLVVPPWRPTDMRHLPAIPVENGSDLVAAVDVARRLAADALPGRGRVIVLSDLQQRRADDGRLASAIGAVDRTGAASGDKPLVHVVSLPPDMSDGEGADFVRRQTLAPDAHKGDALVDSVERTGGIVVVVDTDGAGDVRTLARHLVRPARVDWPALVVDGRVVPGGAAAAVAAGSDEAPAFAVDAASWRSTAQRPRPRDDDLAADAAGVDAPDFVVEGGGLRASWHLRGAPRRVALRGWLWGTPVEWPLHGEGGWRVLSLSRAVHDLDDVLDDEVVRAAATRGGFVARTSSLLAVPTWRPPVPDGMGGGWSSTCTCHAPSRGVGFASRGSATGTGPRTLVEQQVLERLARGVAARCAAAVDADVEVGDLEVLDVTGRAGGRCAREGLWGLRLDRARTGDASFQAQRVLTVRVAGPVAIAGADDAP